MLKRSSTCPDNRRIFFQFLDTPLILKAIFCSDV